MHSENLRVIIRRYILSLFYRIEKVYFHVIGHFCFSPQCDIRFNGVLRYGPRFNIIIFVRSFGYSEPLAFVGNFGDLLGTLEVFDQKWWFRKFFHQVLKTVS